MKKNRVFRVLKQSDVIFGNEQQYLVKAKQQCPSEFQDMVAAKTGNVVFIKKG